jgi:prepilin-type N-terminal cleavage/methylation domain-containing protein
MKTKRPTRCNAHGYTLVEVMVAVSIFTVVMTVALAAFSMAGRRTQAGTRQALFNQMARLAQQRIARYIEEGKTVALESDYLAITSVDFTTAAIRFEPGADHPERWEQNALVYYADVDNTNTREVITQNVAPIDSQPIFSIQPSSPVSAHLVFHIGQSADEQAGLAGPGLSGVDIRISATPRNRQRWYD